MKEFWNEFKYGFYVMSHPFDGFWDLKHEKRGSFRAATANVIIMIIVMILKRQTTAFYFNEYDPMTFNPVAEVGNAFLPFILWVVSNWCFTTLMNGEGTMKDVYIASGYALLPFSIINIIAIIASYFLTEETASLYTLIVGIGIVYLGAMLFFGMMVTHQYEFGKGLVTALLTVAGILVMIYLGLLFCKVVTNITSFISSLIYEFRIRILV